MRPLLVFLVLAPLSGCVTNQTRVACERAGASVNSCKVEVTVWGMLDQKKTDALKTLLDATVKWP